MDVNPTRAAPVEAASANKGDDFPMRHWTRLVHLLVFLQELLPAATVADEQFAVYQFMAARLAER